VTVLGIPKHAKDAAEGVNAIVRLAKVLQVLAPHPALAFIAEAVGEDATGAHLFGPVSDEPSGSLSFNIAGLTVSPEESEIRIDIRIPVLADKEKLVQTLTDKASDYRLVYEEFDYLAPLYVPKDSFLVSTLMDIYKELTGDINAQPVAIGGGTYAKYANNTVAFGALLPEQEDRMHQRDEYLEISKIDKLLQIYVEAIYKLAK